MNSSAIDNDNLTAPATGARAMVKTARDTIADTVITTLEGKMSTLQRVEDDLGEDNADKVIAALNAAGFVIVPKVPTQAMLNSAECSQGEARHIYTEMIRFADVQ